MGPIGPTQGELAGCALTLIFIGAAVGLLVGWLFF